MRTTTGHDNRDRYGHVDFRLWILDCEIESRNSKIQNETRGISSCRQWKLQKKLCREAKVETFSYHDIRHTVAKYLNDLKKVGLKKVQQVMRHKKQTTTEIYVEGNYTCTQDVMKLQELRSLENLSENSLSHNEAPRRKRAGYHKETPFLYPLTLTLSLQGRGN